MKKKIIVSIALLLLTSLSVLRAQTVLVDWTFDNASNTPPVYHPVPSAGLDLATAYADTVGMTNNLTVPPSVGAPDVIANPAVGVDSTPTLPDAWRIRATGTTSGNGWDSAAAIGAQGAVFSASTLGYDNIQLTFDITATTQGEGYMQVEYTVDGINWSNAPITYPANPALVLTNANPQVGTNGLVIGSYLSMVTNLVTGKYVQIWFTNVTANFSGVPAVNNNPNFAVRIVNAATGTNCVSASNTQLNNTSGNCSLDNILIIGTPPASPITAWDFDNTNTYSQTVMNNSPVPSTGSGLATALGMNNSYNGVTSLTSCDITSTPGASTGLNSAAWRVRGGGGTYATIGAPNGWSTQAPLGTQGAEFDASTAGYTNVQLSFDIYYTSAAPAQTAVEYTTDGINWSNAATLTYAANPAFIVTNNTDPNTVTGTYFSQTAGSAFYTNLTATFPAGAANNASFGVRIVNATTGSSEVGYNDAAYNNSSGNWRYDNIVISGVATGNNGVLPPPVLSPATGISVTNSSFALVVPNGFTAWESAITNITVSGVVLLSPTYTNGVTVTSTNIMFSMAASVIYQTSGTLSISIAASGYSADKVSQVITPGPATQMAITAQPAAPAGNGGTLVSQPGLTLMDVYGNVATGSVATATATVGGSGSWILGGGTTVTAVGGVMNFTNLSATSAAAYSSAVITFTTTAGFPAMNATAFNISAPATAFTTGNLAVEQEDLATKNSTFSILELSPTAANQSSPVNIFPISATGTNALRQASSGSTGRLADSDDGSLVCFSAALCGDSTVADATTVDPRGAGTLNGLGAFTLQATYIGLGDATANQARSAVSVDNLTWFMGDKGGVYTNGNTAANTYIPYSVSNPANVRSLKSFGGTVYVLQEEGGTDPDSLVLSILPAPANATSTPIPGAPANGSQSLFPLEGFPIDGAVLDFYLLRSGNNGNIYDVAYYIDGTNTTSGVIYKYYYTGQIDPNTSQQVWASAGSSWPTPNGGDGLCARTNATGGVDLFYTTGDGGSPGNSVVMVHDSSAWNQPINLTATNQLYTVATQTTLKGIAFAPINTNSTSGTGGTVVTPFKITPGSVHLTGSGASTSLSLSFTNATGLSFSVLGTNNLAAPRSTWPVIGHAVETPAGSGQYQFTDTNPATNGVEFYLLRQP